MIYSRKKIKAFIVILIVAFLGSIIFVLFGGSSKEIAQGKNVNKKVTVTNKKNRNKEDAPDTKVSGTLNPKSRAITNEKLPWEDNKKFLLIKEKYKTNIRMAAFKTVLPDPLPGEEENVSIAADMLAGTVIAPGEVFSQNAVAGPYTSSRGYKKGPTYSGGRLITTIGGGVCKIATTLYNVAIMSCLHIVERHNHSMIVPYVPPGQDATVYYGSRDIKFMNDKAYPILLWAQSEGTVLYIALYGREKPPKVTWYHKILNETDTYYIHTHNPKLPKGTKKVVMEGYKGYKVKTLITMEKQDGTKETKSLGVDYYSPMPGLIEVGTGD